MELASSFLVVEKDLVCIMKKIHEYKILILIFSVNRKRRNSWEICVEWGVSMEVASSFLVVEKDCCDVKCIRSRLLLNMISVSLKIKTFLFKLSTKQSW